MLETRIENELKCHSVEPRCCDECLVRLALIEDLPMGGFGTSSG
jgi:hypothetical protein